MMLYDFSRAIFNFYQGVASMKKGFIVLVFLSVFTSLILAQDEPYIQVNSGADVLVNSGQSAYIVLQMNNPSSETLVGVTVVCDVETVTGSVEIDTENTQAYILETTVFSETSVTFGQDADVDFPAGQSGNVQLVVDVEASDEEIAKARITCALTADGEDLGSVEIELASTGFSSPSGDSNGDDTSEADGSTISINNGAEIRVAEDESIELVIQVGNAGNETLNNVVLTCVLGDGLNVVEDRTYPRDFISYAYDSGIVVFGEGEDVSLPSGQNTTVALGVVLDSNGDATSASVGCSLASDSEEDSNELGNTVISNRDAENDDDSTTSESTDESSSEGSLSINNGSEMTLGEGQSAELVVQFGNSSDEILDSVSIVCNITVDAGAISFNDERTHIYTDGSYVIEGDTLTMSIDTEMPQGQNMNVAVGIQVDEADTDGTVGCELLNNADSLGIDVIAVRSN